MISTLKTQNTVTVYNVYKSIDEMGSCKLLSFWSNLLNN